MLYCEFCGLNFNEPMEVRRHVLSVSHIRSRRAHDLSQTKFLDKLHKSAVHPRTIFELAKLLNLYSAKDVMALDKIGFFKINTLYQSKIVRELIQILSDSASSFYVDSLPAELREPFLKSFNKSIKDKSH